MNLHILNRDFTHPADGWYQIEAKGNHMNRAAGVVQVIDDEASQTIVNRFNADAKAGKLRHGSDMLIDHEHFSDQPDKESVAYGWLQELQNRDDGIYGRIKWTATGKPAVDGGDYRFFSTEYSPDDLKILNDGKSPRRVRPLRLDGLTLTNMNNNRGQKPITNRNANFPGGVPPGDSQQQPNESKKMKSVCTALGLSPDAAEDVVLAEVTKLKNRGEITPADLTTLRSEHTTFKTLNDTLLNEQCDALMDAHGIKGDDKVRNRLRPVLAGLKNRDDRTAALAEFGFKPVEAGKGAATQVKLNNRDTKPPGKDAAAETDGKADQAKATKIMNRAHAIQKETPNTSLATAVGMAQKEIENAS